MNGTYDAVIDRIVEGTWAAFEILEEGTSLTTINTRVEEVPDDCRYEGALFEVDVDDDEIVEMHHGPEQEQERRERIRKQAERIGKPLYDEDERE